MIEKESTSSLLTTSELLKCGWMNTKNSCTKEIRIDMRKQKQVGESSQFARIANKSLEMFSGDISYQLYIKDRQKCKPFKYFMEVVAPDMLDRYPYEDPPEFASGAIQTMADTKYCMDTMSRPREQPIGNISTMNRIIWLFKLRLQACTFAERTESVRKIISISYCDTIETSHWRTCKTASIATIRERRDLSRPAAVTIVKEINISDTIWSQCKSTTGLSETGNASRPMSALKACTLQTVIPGKLVKNGNGDSLTRRTLEIGCIMAHGLWTKEKLTVYRKCYNKKIFLFRARQFSLFFSHSTLFHRCRKWNSRACINAVYAICSVCNWPIIIPYLIMTNHVMLLHFTVLYLCFSHKKKVRNEILLKCVYEAIRAGCVSFLLEVRADNGRRLFFKPLELSVSNSFASLLHRSCE